MVRFKEYIPFAGVDETATPTGIVVPVGPDPDKYNLLLLTGGQGIRLGPPPSVRTIKIEDVTTTTRGPIGWSMGWLQPGDRLFKISGIVPVSGVQVQALGSVSQGTDTLQIAVLKPRTVKLAIRPVMVRNPLNPQGAIPHTKVGGDIPAMVDQMNEIWTPQANVVFTLVPSTPAQFTDEARIAKIMGVSTATAPLPDDVNIQVFWDLLAENRAPNADLTMFLVQKCSSGPQADPKHDHGVTDWKEGVPWGISLIGDTRAQFPAVMAHEAGHFLGKMRGHTDDPVKDEKTGQDKVLDKRKQLMEFSGGTFAYTDKGSILIPFDRVTTFNPQ